MSITAKTFCRICTAFCPTEVEIEDGRPVRVVGDRSYPLYGGYTCSKGRALPQFHLDPDRLLFSMKKGTDGKHHRIPTDQAITEIAEKLAAMVEQYGPRSVAVYLGTPVAIYPALAHLATAFLEALGSPMLFATATIDQPGLNVADAFHGRWGGGRIRAADADVVLIVGGNPVISKQYLSQNPARKLKDGVNGGGKLIVIDPRKTESSRRAHVHLQVRPGEDASVLAGLLHLLIRQDAIDHDFLQHNVVGLESLSQAVRHFTPEYVAQRAGVEVADLVEAARLLGAAKKGYLGGGTGIGMSGHGNLCFYLLLCIQSVRGFWARAGDEYNDSSVLRPKVEARAQAYSPYSPILSEEARVRGLRLSVAGMPTSTLLDEILTPGEGQVRALFCLANPMVSMPDADRTAMALNGLELLVTPNVEMSATAQMSHYVIATNNILETPAATHFIEGAKAVHYGYSWDVPHAQYTPALLPPPADSDLIEDAHIFYRLAQHMGLKLALSVGTGLAISQDETGSGSVSLDMENEPTTDELFDIYCRNSNIPLSEVRKHPGPHTYSEVQQLVLPSDPDWEQRLDIGNETMLAELSTVSTEQPVDDEQYPFRLIPRRADHVVGSVLRYVPAIHKITYNPAFMNPRDLDALGIKSGERVEIRSRYNVVAAIAQAEAGLRRGVISMSHSYGPRPGDLDDPAVVGTNVNRLLRMDVQFDPITGSPLMAAVPVNICAA